MTDFTRVTLSEISDRVKRIEYNEDEDAYFYKKEDGTLVNTNTDMRETNKVGVLRYVIRRHYDGPNCEKGIVQIIVDNIELLTGISYDSEEEKSKENKEENSLSILDDMSYVNTILNCGEELGVSLCVPDNLRTSDRLNTDLAQEIKKMSLNLYNAPSRYFSSRHVNFSLDINNINGKGNILNLLKEEKFEEAVKILKDEVTVNVDSIRDTLNLLQSAEPFGIDVHICTQLTIEEKKMLISFWYRYMEEYGLLCYYTSIFGDTSSVIDENTIEKLKAHLELNNLIIIDEDIEISNGFKFDKNTNKNTDRISSIGYLRGIYDNILSYCNKVHKPGARFMVTTLNNMGKTQSKLYAWVTVTHPEYKFLFINDLSMIRYIKAINELLQSESIPYSYRLKIIAKTALQVETFKQRNIYPVGYYINKEDRIKQITIAPSSNNVMTSLDNVWLIDYDKFMNEVEFFCYKNDLTLTNNVDIKLGESFITEDDIVTNIIPREFKELYNSLESTFVSMFEDFLKTMSEKGIKVNPEPGESLFERFLRCVCVLLMKYLYDYDVTVCITDIIIVKDAESGRTFIGAIPVHRNRKYTNTLAGRNRFENQSYNISPVISTDQNYLTSVMCETEVFTQTSLFVSPYLMLDSLNLNDEGGYDLSEDWNIVFKKLNNTERDITAEEVLDFNCYDSSIMSEEEAVSLNDYIVYFILRDATDKEISYISNDKNLVLDAKTKRFQEFHAKYASRRNDMFEEGIYKFTRQALDSVPMSMSSMSSTGKYSYISSYSMLFGKKKN